MDSESEVPAPTEAGTHHDRHVDNTQNTCLTGRCAMGTVCTCAYYRDWIVVSSAPEESVSAQLQRRRQAAYRCPRLASYRRDPISGSVW